MNFLVPCDDIIDDITNKPDTLSINPSLVIIGYKENQWSNTSPIKELKFPSFQSLLSTDDNITIDNIVYIKYIDIYLWHKQNKIDRISGSGSTPKSDLWDKIKTNYTQHLKSMENDDIDSNESKDDEKESKNANKKVNKININIDKNPKPILGQQQRRRYYRYWWRNPATEIINNGYYEITDNLSGQITKIKVEKSLKKSHKKTKLYHENVTFKFLTTKQLDQIYRIYENMEINIISCTSLNALYRIKANEDKVFKKICVLNVYGRDNDNGFYRNSTLNHSLSRYEYEISTDSTDTASEYLYTNTMVYSPNCVIFNDVNGDLTANNFKVSFLTVYPVNSAEYYRIKRQLFDEPAKEERLKQLDDKLQSNGQKSFNKSKKFKHKNNNKSKKRTQQETEEYIAKLNIMKDTIAEIMKDRIRRMIEIAIYNGCDCIVFDAFGCDKALGNDVRDIAITFSEYMKTVYHNCFKAVYFTILDEGDGNDNDKKRNGVKNLKDKKDVISTFRLFQDAFESKLISSESTESS